MSALRWSIGSATVTRVSYFDIGLPPESVDLDAPTIADLQTAGHNTAPWIDDDGNVLVGQSIWVIESEGTIIVLDPCGASDAFLRTGAEARVHQDAAFAAFTNAGFDRSAVDIVLLSHLDGIGMAAWMNDEDGWEPSFPNAPILVSRPEYEAIQEFPEIPGAAVFRELDATGAIGTIDPPHHLTADVSVALTGGHSRGHLAVHIASGDDANTKLHGVFLGHLAVSPLHLLLTPGDALHVDPDQSARVRAELLATASRNDALVFGPLWPAPGVVSASDYVATS